MASYRRVIERVATLLRWNKTDRLILQPKFQRRLAWRAEARAYLIDTILRNLPMPKVFLRRTRSGAGGHARYEVVDGQQHLAAIIDFSQNRLPVSPKHSRAFGGMTFDELPEAAQRCFLEYEVSLEVMEKATDREVWGMFERLNTYTLTLNRQERLNAEFFGYFKQTAYDLAAEQTEHETWQRMRLMTDHQIARMKEVELTSDVLTAIAVGIQDITYLRKIYSDRDDNFPEREQAAKVFRQLMEFAKDELIHGIRRSRFRNKAWMYSLLVSLADALAGIPEGLGPRTMVSGAEIMKRMQEMDSALKAEELGGELLRLKDALSRGTSHSHQRKIRHERFYNMLVLSPDGWEPYWGQLLRG